MPFILFEIIDFENEKKNEIFFLKKNHADVRSFHLSTKHLMTQNNGRHLHQSQN